MSAAIGDWLLLLKERMPSWWTTRTINEENSMRMHNPPHPGSVLREYLGNTSVTEAAEHLGVTRAALSRILNGSAGISAEMALRLADALGTTPDLWIGMQSQYDLWRASTRRRAKVARLLPSSDAAIPKRRMRK
jgi:addiction module HigA family antidote